MRRLGFRDWHCGDIHVARFNVRFRALFGLDHKVITADLSAQLLNQRPLGIFFERSIFGVLRLPKR
jgi:hypothetical protein